jgi:hypothetical protein
VERIPVKVGIMMRKEFWIFSILGALAYIGLLVLMFIKNTEITSFKEKCKAKGGVYIGIGHSMCLKTEEIEIE